MIANAIRRKCDFKQQTNIDRIIRKRVAKRTLNLYRCGRREQETEFKSSTKGINKHGKLFLSEHRGTKGGRLNVDFELWFNVCTNVCFIQF